VTVVLVVAKTNTGRAGLESYGNVGSHEKLRIADPMGTVSPVALVKSLRPDVQVEVIEFDIISTIPIASQIPNDAEGMSAPTRDRNAGAAAEPVRGPLKTLFALCVFNAAVTVPDVVTAELGVVLRTSPSPVNVTLVTVPDPEGAV
jgi:hypothetical protein